MSMNIENQNGVTIIHLSSEIDLDSAPSVRSQIKDSFESSSAVHVDLGKVNYIDSSGIASLVEGMQTSKKLKKEFIRPNGRTQFRQQPCLRRLGSKRCPLRFLLKCWQYSARRQFFFSRR